MRVVLYARLSVETEVSTSIDRQVSEMERVATARGWEVVDTFTDSGVSATRARLDRPGLNAARKAVEEGRAAAILVWRLDRLARNLSDLSALMDAGTGIISATEAVDTTTSGGRAMAGMLTIIADMESGATRERVSSMRAALARQGRWGGGKRPFGYQSAPRDGGGRTLVIDPEQALVVRRIMKLCLDGIAPYSIAKGLNQEGIKTQSGAQWSARSVILLMKSPHLREFSTYRGEIVRGDDGRATEFYPAIISAAESEAITAALAPRAPGQPTKRSATPALLSGFAFCANCDGRLRHQYQGGRSTYVCHTRALGKECPAGVSINAAKLEDYVTKRFLERFGHKEVTRRVRFTREADELAQVREAEARAWGAVRDVPLADRAAHLAMCDELAARRAELEATAVTGERREPLGYTVGQGWTDKNSDERRRILSAAEVRVEVRSGVRGVLLIEDRVRVSVGNPDWQ